MAMLETPSRVWRRIDAAEAAEMPSLPSLPAFDDSTEQSELESDNHQLSTIYSEPDVDDPTAPVHSTPAAVLNTVTLSARPPSSTSSTARFASSIASRSTNGRPGNYGLASFSRITSVSAVKGRQESFDVSVIPSLPDGRDGSDEDEMEDTRKRYLLHKSKDSVPDVYLPPEEEDDAAAQHFSLTEALESVSRASSPFPHDERVEQLYDATPKKYDYSVSLRSEPKASPFDKFRNVALRKPTTLARTTTRTPSLSRTTPSPSSSSSLDSTPNSIRSIPLPSTTNHSPATVPLPRSNTASPAVQGVGVQPPDDGEGSDLNLSDLQDYEESLIQQQPEAETSESDEYAHFEHDYNPEQEPEHGQGQQEELLEHEPTFSSSDGRSQHSQDNPKPDLSRSHSPAFSSPAPSIAFTPTPANPPRPRPRARFPLSLTPRPGAHVKGDNAVNDDDENDDFGPITPHARRRSFLLDVINSSARPRMKFPTPHPRYAGTPRVAGDVNTDVDTDVDAESTPGAGNLRTAFAGATPRVRVGTGGRRVSHPLAQTFIASASPEPTPSSPPPTSSGLHFSSLQTPTPFSPYQPSPCQPSASTSSSLSAAAGVGLAAQVDSDRPSFISTASSHDLTTHTYARANASFDPIMGLGDRGTGVGRFNAGKLNAYLHGLNRRLAEENEALVGRLRRLEEERAVVGVGGRRVSTGGRRVSAVGSALGDVQENVGAEGWAEEKKELEEMVDMLNEEISRGNEAREEVEKALEEEREERERDKERWKDRMGEVERGVEGIVKELERKIEEADRKAKQSEQDKTQVERAMETVEEERDVAVERAEKAEKMLEDGRELGGELKDANDRVAQVMGDLRNANTQIRELEEEVMRSDGRVDELEKELKEEKAVVNELDGELAEANNRLAVADEELKANKAYITDLETNAGAAVDRIEDLEAQLASADEKLRGMDAQEEKMDQLEAEAAAKADFARQMEEALESAERKMIEDEEKVAQLVGRVASLEREKERERETWPDPSQGHMDPNVHIDVEALESELDDANKEIARLNTLLSQSPARKAIEKAKEMKIEMLEKEKDDLLERVKVLRNTMNDIGTPNRFANASGISPIHRQVLSTSIRAPRTPGAPLRDMSWLNNSAADPTVSPLIAEISRLQRELDRANESIDDKLDKLEDAGLGVVGLTKKLEDARSKIVASEGEVARLSRREDRRVRRLERARCQKCHVKIDLRSINACVEADESSFEITTSHLPSEPPTPPTKTSEALRANLQSVNAQLDTMKKQWETEKKQLLGEKAVLQDAAKRLNVQIRSVKEEVKTERARAGSEGELDKAKRAIADLEAELQVERGRLRTLTTEQGRIQRQKDDVLLQLQRTESDMNDVKKQLHKFKQENHGLETELRMNANVEQKARLLEVRVAENAETIEQLRQERALLVSDHKELQQRFSEISERASKLRDERATSQTSHNARRHQLDLRLVEIDDLRQALSNQADELQRSEEERNRIVSQKSDVARTVALLESDLKRVRRDAEVFGRDLQHLRAEKERWDAKQKDEASKAERARKQSQAQIRLLNEQLDGQREKARRAKEDLRNHVCAVVDESQLSAIKVQHNKECKGLIVQIRYLKAKFTRESSLRCDLGYQKQYLLVLLTKFEKSEQRILTSIARIGYPTAAPKPSKTRSLKSVVLSVMFILRAKRASDIWREQSASKEAVAAALQDVRRRRATTAS